MKRYAKDDSPRDEVAVSVYPPAELPTNMFPYEGAVVSPVPPYNTPTDDVAETSPLFACSGPDRVPRVNVELNVLAPVKVLDEYVLGIVVEAFTKNCAEVVENEFARYVAPSSPSNVPVHAPVLSRVTLPFAYIRPEENVVVAVQVGTPFKYERTYPAVPAVVVARFPDPLPYSRAEA